MPLHWIYPRAWRHQNDCRVAALYFPGRNLKQTRLDLRKGFYGCDTDSPRSDWQGKKWGIVNVAGCWRTAEGEINRWISNDRAHVADGLAGTVTELQGAEAWTKTAAGCLDIGDMELDVEPALEPNMAVPHITADDEAEELEEVGGGWGGSEEGERDDDEDSAGEDIYESESDEEGGGGGAKKKTT